MAERRQQPEMSEYGRRSLCFLRLLSRAPTTHRERKRDRTNDQQARRCFHDFEPPRLLLLLVLQPSCRDPRTLPDLTITTDRKIGSKKRQSNCTISAWRIRAEGCEGQLQTKTRSKLRQWIRGPAAEIITSRSFTLLTPSVSMANSLARSATS